MLRTSYFKLENLEISLVLGYHNNSKFFSEEQESMNKKIITALMAVTLFAGGGAAVSQIKPARVIAASKKSSRFGVIQVASKSPAYQVVFTNGNTKIKKIAALKRKGKHLRFKANRYISIFYTNYRGIKYYVLNGGTLAVRTKNAKKIGKRKINSFKKSYVYKKALKKYQRDQKIKSWNDKLNQAKRNMKTFSAKVTNQTAYLTFNSKSNKWEQSSSVLPIGTELIVLCKVNSQNNNSTALYLATTANGQTIFVPSTAVALDDTNAQVPDLQTYEKNVKGINDIIKAANQALNKK